MHGFKTSPFLLIVLLFAILIPAEAQEKRSTSAVSVSTLRARLQPDLEVILPTGEVSQASNFLLSPILLHTEFVFHTLENQVMGLVTVSRAEGAVIPYISVSEHVDFERDIDPRLTDGNVEITPTERRVARTRTLEPGISWRPFQPLTIKFDVAIEDRYSGNLDGDTEAVQDLGLTPQLGVTFDRLRPLSAARSPLIVGDYYHLGVHQLFAENFSHPVASGLRATFIGGYTVTPHFHASHRLSVLVPIHIQDTERFTPLALGGYDNVRGYTAGDVAGIGALLSRNTFAFIPVPDGANSSGGSTKQKLRIHSLRMLLALDGALMDQNMAIDSQFDLFGSIGPGLGMTISTRRGLHLDVTALTAFADFNAPPVFYIRTSLYVFNGK